MIAPSRHGARTVRHVVHEGMFVRRYDAEGARPPLLFVHGLGESGLCFERIVEHPKLACFDCVVVDLPGYGRSAWTDRVASLEQLADHLAVWVGASFRRCPPVLVGHSMGGVVALLAAERHPDAFRAVVDVDGNKSTEDCAFSGRAAKLSLAEFVGGGFDAMIDDIFEQGLSEAAHRGYYASLRLCDPRAYHAHSLELVGLSEGGKLAKRLAALGRPKIYVAGKPGGACERSLELLREADVPTSVIAPSGHWPFLDQPEAFADVLAAFLERHQIG